MDDHRQLADLVLRVEAARAHLVSALGHQVVDLDEVQAARRELHAARKAARKELHVVGRPRVHRVAAPVAED